MIMPGLVVRNTFIDMQEERKGPPARARALSDVTDMKLQLMALLQGSPGLLQVSKQRIRSQRHSLKSAESNRAETDEFPIAEFETWPEEGIENETENDSSASPSTCSTMSSLKEPGQVSGWSSRDAADTGLRSRLNSMISAPCPLRQVDVSPMQATTKTGAYNFGMGAAPASFSGCGGFTPASTNYYNAWMSYNPIGADRPAGSPPSPVWNAPTVTEDNPPFWDADSSLGLQTESSASLGWSAPTRCELQGGNLGGRSTRIKLTDHLGKKPLLLPAGPSPSRSYGPGHGAACDTPPAPSRAFSPPGSPMSTQVAAAPPLPAENTEEEDLTTVMLRNIPNSYTSASMLELLDRYGFFGKYDFVYLPMDFQKGVNLGYAFVNFQQSGDGLQFASVFQGFADWQCSSAKAGDVSWAQPNQGLQAHVDRYRNSPVMHPSVPDGYKPMVFHRGHRTSFPTPTRNIKAPKMRLFKSMD